MIKQAYINGFMRKCAEYGINDTTLIKKALFGSIGRTISNAYANKARAQQNQHDTAVANYKRLYGKEPTLLQHLNPFSKFNVMGYKDHLGIGPNSYPRAEAGAKAITDANGNILTRQQMASTRDMYRNGQKMSDRQTEFNRNSALMGHDFANTYQQQMDQRQARDIMKWNRHAGQNGNPMYNYGSSGNLAYGTDGALTQNLNKLDETYGGANALTDENGNALSPQQIMDQNTRIYQGGREASPFMANQHRSAYRQAYGYGS